jgi:hypothetical protein
VSAPSIPNREEVGILLDYRVGRPRADHRSTSEKKPHLTSEDIFFFRLIVIYLLHNQTTHDMQSLKFFCAGLSCFVLAIFLLFYGYQLMPFESIAAEIFFFSLLVVGSAVFIGQAIWLAIEKKFE